MAGSFEGVLANIPGYGGYLAKETYNRNQTLGDIQQMTGLQGLMAQMQQQQMAQGIRGVLSDQSIPDDQKIQRLAQFGEPGMKVAGTLAALQKQQADMGREKAFRTDLAALGDAPTQEQLASVAARHGTASDVLKTQQASLDRAAQRDATLEAKKLQIDAQIQAAREKGENAKTLMEMQLAGRREIAQLAASLRQAPAPHPMDLMGEDGRVYKVDARTGQRYGISPADNKMQGVLNQDTASLNGGLASFDRLAAAANDALSAPGLPGTAGLRGAIPNIPGSDAADAAAKLNTLKSQIAFGVLQEMRNNSKTGGALGSVSDKEQEMLKSALAPIEKSQSIEELRKSLKGVIDYANGAKDRMRAAYNMKHGERQMGGATGSFGAPKTTDSILNQADAILKGQ